MSSSEYLCKCDCGALLADSFRVCENCGVDGRVLCPVCGEGDGDESVCDKCLGHWLHWCGEGCNLCARSLPKRSKV